MFRQFTLFLATFILCGQALAGPITFNFVNGTDSVGDPLFYSVNGLNLRITGDPGVAVDGALGLGVRSAPNDDDQVDGNGFEESLHMLFSQTVDLIEVVFNRVGWDDEATVYTTSILVSGEIPGAAASDLGIGIANTTERGLVDSSSYWFGILASDDDYYIASLTVEVPNPNAMGLLLIGLLALGLAKLAKRQRLS